MAVSASARPAAGAGIATSPPVEGCGCRRLRASAPRGLRVTRVFWDTNLFVYLLEGGAFAPRVRHVRSRMLERGDHLVTSALTLGELLVKPRAAGESVLRDHEATI